MLFILLQPRNIEWATATGDPSLHKGIPPDAVRFLPDCLLLLSLCSRRLYSPAVCRIVLEEKKKRRVVVSAFEEACFSLYHLEVGLNRGHKGLFEGESVRQRVVQLRRAAPIPPLPITND
jgi:hypothetical protein